MYLIYIDDSGKPLITEKSNFCYGACLVHELNWTTMDGAIENLKLTVNKVIDNPEVHMIDILNANIPKESKYKLIDDIYTEINKIDFTIIYTAIIKNRINRQLDFKLIALTRLFEKVNMFLFYGNKPGKFIDHGFLVFDNEGNLANKKINQLMRYLFRKGSKYVKNHYLIEEPLFAQSELKCGIQLADAIIVCVRRHYDYLAKLKIGEKTNEFDLLFEKHFNILKTKLYADGDRLYGVTEYPVIDYNE